MSSLSGAADYFLLLESHMLRKSTSSSLRFLQAGERRETTRSDECTVGGCLLVIFLLLHPCLCPRSWRNRPLWWRFSGDKFSTFSMELEYNSFVCFKWNLQCTFSGIISGITVGFTL